MTNNQHSKREPKKSRRPAAPSDATPESRARSKVKKLWQYGDLFHVTNRYPRKPNVPRVDRLAGILKSGLVAPGRCEDGSVRSDFNLLVTGASVPYESLIFLHRFGAPSYIYTIYERNRFAVFVDPALPVKTPEDMEDPWVTLSQDEVYVPDRIAPENLIGIAVHPEDADSVRSELLAEFRRLHLPLYDYDGKVLWPPG